MIEGIANILKVAELRGRIFFTLAMIAVYRLGIFVPAPGVDRVALGQYVDSNSGGLLGFYDMFSGGALANFSVFVLGIMPYISASIIVQLGQVVLPQVERLKNEGQAGKKKLNQYTRYLTIGIALVQSLAIALSMESMVVGGSDVVVDPGWGFRILTMITMTAGSCFVMWLGEQITDRGIGNGSSLIISTGILAGIPSGVTQLMRKVDIGEINLLQCMLLLAFMVVVMMAIVFMERGQRRVPIQYAKRIIGRRTYGGQGTHLPLKVNVAGVIPPIFASSVMMFPATIQSLFPHPLFQALASAFTPGSWVYNVTFIVLIVVFAYFYTAVTFNPVDVADNLRKHGGYIPGVRPGKPTAEYLDHILSRLIAAGALYLAALCLLPSVLISAYGIPFYFGGTSLLIVVGVSLDTVAQIEGHLLTRQYDGTLGAQGGGRGRRRALGEDET